MAYVNIVALLLMLTAVLKANNTAKEFEEMAIKPDNPEQLNAVNLSLKHLYSKYGEDNVNAMKLISMSHFTTSAHFFRLIYAVNGKGKKEVELYALYVVTEYAQGNKTSRVYTAFKVEAEHNITIHKTEFVSIQNQMRDYFNKHNKHFESITSIKQFETDSIVHLEVNGEDRVYIVHRYDNNELNIIEFL